MTTVTVWKGEAANVYLKVRWGRKHGRPRGRGRKRYWVIVREEWNHDHFKEPFEGESA